MTTNWTELPAVNSNGALKTLTDSAAVTRQRFYPCGREPSESPASSLNHG